MVEENQKNTTQAEAKSKDSVEPEPFVSKSQQVADSLEPKEIAEETTEKSGEDLDSDLGDLLASEIGEEDSLEEPSGEVEKKTDNVQKRIDELTAKSKTYQEQFEATKEQLAKALDIIKNVKKEDVPKEKTPNRLSDAELSAAIKDFMEENDTAGILNVINYKLKLQKEDMVNEYQAERRQEQEKAAKRNHEWQTIIKDFSPEGYEETSLNNNPNFNINNKDGQLYQLAEKLFTEHQDLYSGNGGMRSAVKDAFQKLLRALVGAKKSESKEAEGLKNRIAKEQRKKSISDGISSTDSDVGKKKEIKEDLDEVLSERRKFKNARIGMM